MKKITALLLLLLVGAVPACAGSRMGNSGVQVNTPKETGANPNLPPTLPVTDGLVFRVHANYGVFESVDYTDHAEVGDAVRVWQDFSGQGNHLTQELCSACRPLLKDDVPIGGKRTVRTDGSDDWMLLPLSLNGSKTVIIVGRMVSAPSNGGTFLNIKHNTTPTFSEYTLFSPQHANHKDWSGRQDYTSSANGQGTVYTIDTASHVWTARYNGSTRISTDGNEIAATNCTGCPFAQGSSGLGGIGARPSSTGPTNPALEINFDFTEILIFNRYLSDAELNSLGDYTNEQYGLTWNDI